MATRVILVEDSPVIQKAIVDVCTEGGADIQIVATSPSASEGLAKIFELRPDVVILDIGLPDIEGFEVVQSVMAKAPTPILIFTATLKPSWRRPAFDALTMGAVDVMRKPTGRELAEDRWRENFRSHLKLIARAPVIPHIQENARSVRRRGRSSKHTEVPLCLVIVGSAGSPRAVSLLLQEMRPAFPLPMPVLVALHLGEGMGASFARHLEGVLSHRTVEMNPEQEREDLRAGTIYVVPGQFHAALAGIGKVRTFSLLPGANYVPSLDHLLASVAKTYGAGAAGVILSGMGADGAEGLLAVRRSGGLTVGQDEQSALVYGMPKAAWALGAVQVQDSPAGIGQHLLQRIQRTRTLRGAS